MSNVDHRHSMITFAASVYGSCSNGAELIQEIESLNDVADKLSVMALSSIKVSECYQSWTVQDLVTNLDADIHNMMLFKSSLQDNIKAALMCWQINGYAPSEFSGLDMDLLNTVGQRLYSVFIGKDGRQLYYRDGLWHGCMTTFPTHQSGYPLADNGQIMDGAFSLFRKSDAVCH